MPTANRLKQPAPELKTFLKPLAELKPPRGRQIRRHSPAQIQKIAHSLQTYGVVLPVLVGQDDSVIDGWALLLAAKQLGYSDFPVVRVSALSAPKERALRVMLNKLPDYTTWDEAELKQELAQIFQSDPHITVEDTAFEIAEIDTLLHDDGLDQEDELPSVDEQAAPRCQVGDRIICGDHIILCGDALHPDSVAKLLGAEQAGMGFTDAPYNVKIGGHVTTSVTRHDFPMAKGELSPREYQTFLETALSHVAMSSRDGAIHYVCMDWRHAPELLAAGATIFKELKNICVWNKSNAGMGSLYRSQHEFIFVYKVGTAPHINNIALGRHGRNRTNVWNYVSQSALSGTTKSKLALHPTVKPVAMVADAIRDCSKPGDIILDPFGGAGTTMIAAEKTGRRARLLELNPVYVDVTVERWQRLTGQTAYYAATGRPFSANAASNSN
ncbi:ParB N-terminal domain-containing protein [Bradyrhizobium sp. CNPSo 4010]|uniref:Methyltransferase n=1 Tax=Bradyrhizobium agreste TaxID=2751811 RepID=A0ABS0PVQ9_9BRAD|nr:DNA methyltransferase [Bradyrhizobium agreste]MBH5401180.1 ParB N-terminal domain-containing protein [Bradyrhizobium agreste]